MLFGRTGKGEISEKLNDASDNGNGYHAARMRLGAGSGSWDLVLSWEIGTPPRR
jgi:hypothetical protein